MSQTNHQRTQRIIQPYNPSMNNLVEKHHNYLQKVLIRKEFTNDLVKNLPIKKN